MNISFEIKLSSQNNLDKNNGPYCCIRKFDKLSNEIKFSLGKTSFLTTTKRDYYKRCQHSEGRFFLCDFCEERRNTFRKRGFL